MLQPLILIALLQLDCGTPMSEPGPDAKECAELEEKKRLSCEAEGGEWAQVTFVDFACVKPVLDAGKACTSSD